MTTEPHLELDAALPRAVSVPLHVLIVEDDSHMAEWVQQHIEPLRAAFPRAVIEIVSTWLAAQSAIACEPPPNVTLLDLTLPDSTMLETIARVSIIEQRSAVVIITGHKTEDVEALLVDSRVEVLHKSPSLFMPGSIIRAIYRALARKEMADEQQRFKGLREILSTLAEKGYGPSKEQP